MSAAFPTRSTKLTHTEVFIRHHVPSRPSTAGGRPLTQNTSLHHKHVGGKDR